MGKYKILLKEVGGGVKCNIKNSGVGLVRFERVIDDVIISVYIANFSRLVSKCSNKF